MFMMIGVAFSLGAVSTRRTPSIGSAVPRWAVMSSSAGNDMGTALLCDYGTLYGCLVEKGCKWGNFVCRTLDGDDGRSVDLEGGLQCGGQLLDRVDVDGRQAGEHRRQPRSEAARTEPVVAVRVAIEQLFAGHAHCVRVVVEQQEGHRKSVLHRGVNLHAVHVERPVTGEHHGAVTGPLALRASAHRTPERNAQRGAEAVTHAAHAQRDDESAVPANG